MAVQARRGAVSAGAGGVQKKKKPGFGKRAKWVAQDAPGLAALACACVALAGVLVRMGAGVGMALVVVVLVVVALMVGWPGFARWFVASAQLAVARRQWRRVAEALGVEASGRVISVERVKVGRRMMVRLRAGGVATNLASERVASALSSRRRSVLGVTVARSEATPRVVMVLAREVDTLRKVVDPPKPALRSCREPIPVGVNEEHSPICVRLGEPPHLVLGGVPGSGKSRLLHQVIAGWLLDPTTQAVLLDGKHVELNAWSERAVVIGADPKKALVAVRAVRREMDDRFQRMPNGCVKVWDLDADVIARDFPPLMLLVDECTTYFDAGTIGKEIKEHVIHIMRMGRAAAVVVVLATQKPTADALPTAMRDLSEQRIALAVTTLEMGESILGKGYGEEATYTPREQPGRFAAVLGSRVVPGRAYNATTKWVADAAALAVSSASAPPFVLPADNRSEKTPKGFSAGAHADDAPAREDGDAPAASVTPLASRRTAPRAPRRPRGAAGGPS